MFYKLVNEYFNMTFLNLFCSTKVVHLVKSATLCDKNRASRCLYVLKSGISTL